MDSIQKRYKDHIAHYLRQTKRLEAAEAAVRELIEINKRLSKGGQGSTIIPAHIHTKLASWDRKNDNENNRQRAESSYDKYLADETKAIIQSECENTSTIARVKPWTCRRQTGSSFANWCRVCWTTTMLRKITRGRNLLRWNGCGSLSTRNCIAEAPQDPAAFHRSAALGLGAMNVESLKLYLKSFAPWPAAE